MNNKNTVKHVKDPPTTGSRYNKSP